MPESRFADLDGPVHFVEWDGPPGRTIVLVHGLGGSLLSWLAGCAAPPAAPEHVGAAAVFTSVALHALIIGLVLIVGLEAVEEARQEQHQPGTNAFRWASKSASADTTLAASSTHSPAA